MRKVVGAVAMAAAVTFASAQAHAKDADWPTYLGDDAGWSYSPLDQINRENVDRLVPVWTFATGDRGMAAVPAVIDGVMYLIASSDKVYAFDAATGKIKWTHNHGTPGETRGGRSSASVAAAFGMIYYGTTDNYLVALDAATGREVWSVQIEDRTQCGCGPSNGILVAKDKVVVGVRGDVAHRSYINAFDAKTGRQAWRWWSIPGPGEPGHETWRETSPEDLWKYGGGATWYAGTYDPKLNLIYWGTGNPQPLQGSIDLGAKLWTDSLVALDADTGKLKWGFQELPSDPFDYDSTTEPLLMDVAVNGKMTPVVVHSVKSGYTYVFNRATGAVVSTYRHADNINWTKGIDEKGKAIDPLRMSREHAQMICPAPYGSRAANHSAYSPRTGLWYGGSFELCTSVKGMVPGKLVEGRVYFATELGGATLKSPDSKPFVGAYETITGKRRWTVPTELPTLSSLIVTSGDLVFGGDVLGDAWALDAVTGRKLWTFNTGATVSSSPISYSVGGKQYVAIAVGGGTPVLARFPELWPELKDRLLPQSSSIIVFALFEEPKK